MKSKLLSFEQFKELSLSESKTYLSNDDLIRLYNNPIYKSKENLLTEIHEHNIKTKKFEQKGAIK